MTKRDIIILGIYIYVSCNRESFVKMAGQNSQNTVNVKTFTSHY